MEFYNTYHMISAYEKKLIDLGYGVEKVDCIWINKLDCNNNYNWDVAINDFKNLISDIKIKSWYRIEGLEIFKKKEKEECKGFFVIYFDKKENVELLDHIIKTLKNMDYLNNVTCDLSYCAHLDMQRIKKESNEICEKLLGKNIVYWGKQGKIKKINGLYLFYEKYAKKKCFVVNPVVILATHIDK